MPSQQGSWKLINDGGIKAVRDDSLHHEDGKEKSVGGMDEFKSSYGIEVGGEEKKEGNVFGTDREEAEKREKTAKEKGGLNGDWQALGGSVGVSGKAGVGDDGITVEGAAGAQLTLVAGKLYYYKVKEFDFAGQKFRGHIGAELSAEVVAKAEGKVGLNAKNENGAFKVDAGASAEAFAGARGGFQLLAGLQWQDGGEFQDVIGGSVGVEGFAGAAAVAQASLSLVPVIEMSANLGVAVGFGGGFKATLKMNPIAAAKLAWTLAAHGVTVAWEGAKKYGEQIGNWLKAKGKAFRKSATRKLSQTISGIKSFFSGLWGWFFS